MKNKFEITDDMLKEYGFEEPEHLEYGYYKYKNKWDPKAELCRSGNYIAWARTSNNKLMGGKTIETYERFKSIMDDLVGEPIDIDYDKGLFIETKWGWMYKKVWDKIGETIDDINEQVAVKNN